ncbi:NrtA/SsuA/CpmA family ABC transporter substrate-binding protein [Ancylobacter sp. A5.8]|uniref:ABC transporter substrate-binding protein n=1 Tax=Ancylobacter gelatini TaxID=2919920 RepID=UPI001F4D8630|nr:NrtA/SsuA/CpmA family ABC transporter substrate-binding protein [Ancylobacter gelatini]MCJ8142622.1 NrtA/SsuA/CpmA family ABC transporter substrate-binding protein [Ancylobacter gelatini]
MLDRRVFVQGAAGLAIAAPFATFTGEAKAAGSAITVAESEGHGWTVVYVADGAKLWPPNALDVTVAKFTAGRLALDAALTGAANFCTTTQSPTLLAAMRGLKPRIVADFSRSAKEMLVAANRKAGVVKPSDLKGKKVATRIGSSGHFFLNQWLKLHGMTLADVEVVNMAGPEMVTSVVRGDVAAFAWDWLSAVAAQRQAGDDIIILDREGIEAIWRSHLIFVANEETVTKSPELVEAAVKTLFDAEAFIARDPAEARRIVAARTATSEEDTQKGIDLIDIDVRLDSRLIDVMVAEAEWAIAQNIAQPYSGDLRQLFASLIYPDAMLKLRPDRVKL